jgi:hypothetical protein
MVIVGLALGRRLCSDFKLFLSNDCNVAGRVEILDVEVGRNEIVRGCQKK